jgi:hypothetical protein
MSEMQFLRQANLDIIQLKAELGLDDTPLEFEDFLEETKQNTPKAVRAAEYEFENSYDADQRPSSNTSCVSPARSPRPTPASTRRRPPTAATCR